MILPELLQVVPYTAANVHDKHGIGAVVCTLYQALLNREETRSHPGQSALPVSTHMVVEVLIITLFLDETEIVLVGLVRILQRSILRIGRILPPPFAVELVEFELCSS